MPWPHLLHAQCKAVLNWLSVKFTLQFWTDRITSTVSFLASATAMCRAVVPSKSCQLTLDGAAPISVRTQSLAPSALLMAAQCRGVLPSWSGIRLLAPCLMRRRTFSWDPYAAAQWRGVLCRSEALMRGQHLKIQEIQNYFLIYWKISIRKYNQFTCI